MLKTGLNPSSKLESIFLGVLVTAVIGSMDLDRLEGIEFGTEHIIYEIKDLQEGDQPVKVLQLPFVQVIIWEPVAVLVHQGHQEGARVIPD